MGKYGCFIGKIGWLLRVPSQGYHHFPHECCTITIDFHKISWPSLPPACLFDTTGKLHSNTGVEICDISWWGSTRIQALNLNFQVMFHTCCPCFSESHPKHAAQNISTTSMTFWNLSMSPSLRRILIISDHSLSPRFATKCFDCLSHQLHDHGPLHREFLLYNDNGRTLMAPVQPILIECQGSFPSLNFPYQSYYQRINRHHTKLKRIFFTVFDMNLQDWKDNTSIIHSW